MCGVSGVGGHDVPLPSLVTSSDKWLVYGCATDALVVCALKDGLASSCSSNAGSTGGESDFVQNTSVVSLPAGEELSVVCIHPVKDLLCVGTTLNGVYLTTAANPNFSAGAKLSLRFSGIVSHCACFVNGVEEGHDILVMSCLLEEALVECHKLLLWDICSKALLWRGCTEAMVSITAVPGVVGFASCSRRHLLMWSFRNGASSASSLTSTANSAVGADEGSGGTITVFSKTFAAVEELHDVEYVCVVTPASSAEKSLTVLTTKGFLVSFNLHSGEPLKWMDCKISSVTSAYRCGGDIVVCGGLVRFFSEDWVFRGKIRPPEHSLHPGTPHAPHSTGLTCIGAAPCGGNAIAFFFTGGGIVRCRIGRLGVEAKMCDSVSTCSKLTFHCVYEYVPISPHDAPIQLLALTPDVICLHSRHQLRLYGTPLLFSRGNMSFESTCCAYHRDLGVIAMYESSTHQIVAVTPGLERVLCRLGLEVPLTALITLEDNQFVGASTANTIIYLEGQWGEDMQHFSLRLLRIQRFAELKTPFTHLAYSAGVLHVASSREVVNLHTGHITSFNDDIIALIPASGGALLVAHTHSCIFLSPGGVTPVGFPFLEADLRGAASSLGRRYVALYNEGNVHVVELSSGKRVKHISAQRGASGASPTTIRCVGFTADDSSIVVCDSRGVLEVHGFEGTGLISPGIYGDATSADDTNTNRFSRESSCSSSRRAKQLDGPTSTELQNRFKDLHGFYEASRRVATERKAYKLPERHSKFASSTGANSSSGRSTPSPPTSANRSSGKNAFRVQDGDEGLLPTPKKSPYPARRWKAADVPASLLNVGAVGNEILVSASLVEVSALTSIDSKHNDLSSVLEGGAATLSWAVNDIPRDSGKCRVPDSPAYVLQSPTRKGEPLLSPMKVPEDDVVNVDSFDRVDPRRIERLHSQTAGHDDPTALRCDRTNSSGGIASLRARSLDIRDGLKELADAYERLGEEDGDDVDETTMEEMFSTVSRLYTRLQSRQSRRSNSSCSFASDQSSASINAMLANLQLLQCQNSRIEAQNREILSKLSSANGR
ncbi:hypothetical protein DPX39_110040200 [Trypanosoma brucei equiperdum]|uniref:Uncharacterized protein n=1 Tax=Trypanosoma brucei equiperdum TaxID=630700 RepID=A0A3L6KUC7_9TRYP|nr:hypothetical protein DPX39_110040200 [Trypanosoma brucei equiperdum]